MHGQKGLLPPAGASLCGVLETDPGLVGVGGWFPSAAVVLAVVVVGGEEPPQFLQRGIRGEQEVVQDPGQGSAQQWSSPVDLK